MTSNSARQLAARIIAENLAGRSYRTIACEDYPGVKPGTLNRIANSGGEWLPKDRKILRVLGLLPERKKKVYLPGERKILLKIGKMAKRTEEDVMVTK